MRHSRAFHCFGRKTEIRAALRGTLALELFERGEQGVANEYELLGNVCPSMASGTSLEEYKRVWALVNSRVLNYEGNPRARSGKGREAQSALFPVFDLVNHHLPPPSRMLQTDDELHRHYLHTLGRYGLRPSTNAPNAPLHLQLWADQVLEAGQEVTDVYGLKANNDFLWSWGFTVPWIHNLTCLSMSHVHISLPELQMAGAPRAKERRAKLEAMRLDPLRFQFNSCLGDGFLALVSFARYWFTDVDDETLRSSCAFEAPLLDRSGGNIPMAIPVGDWRLNATCRHISPLGEL